MQNWGVVCTGVGVESGAERTRLVCREVLSGRKSGTRIRIVFLARRAIHVAHYNHHPTNT